MNRCVQPHHEEIVGLAVQGWTLDRIAAEMGLSIVTIKTTLREARRRGENVTAVRRVKPDGISPEARAEMVRLNRSGVSGWALSKREWATNEGKARRIDVASVYDFLRRAAKQEPKPAGKYDAHESMMLGIDE